MAAPMRPTPQAASQSGSDRLRVLIEENQLTNTEEADNIVSFFQPPTGANVEPTCFTPVRTN